MPVTCNLYPFLKRIPTTNLHHMLKHFPIPRLGLMRCASSASSIQRGLLSRAGSASQLSERQPVAAGQEYIIVFVGSIEVEREYLVNRIAAMTN